MFQTSWASLALPTLLLSSALAAPAPQRSIGHRRRDPTSARLDNGVIAFVNSYTGNDWKLDYESIGNTGSTGGSIIDKIKSALGVETNSKVTNNDNANKPTSSPAGGHGTGSGRIYTYPANEGSEYLGAVYIGGQTLQINLDTGSSDLWVFSTALEDHERGQHTLYDPSKSNAHQDVPSASFKVSYGDETALTGNVAADTVQIGGVSVLSQAIELPTSFTNGIIDDPSDGILGLGFQPLNSVCTKADGSTNSARCPTGYTPNPRPTWFENAKSALKSGVFAVNLKLNTNGYYDFGSYDSKDFQGDLNYVPVNNAKGYWQFPSQSYRVGGQQGQLEGFGGQDGIADSGTSLLKLDPTVVEAYYAAVQGAENGDSGWTFPCDAKLPDLDIAMGNYLATIKGEAVNYAKSKTGSCYGGIQSTGGKGPQIFGDIFFKSNFVVFDYDGMRLGVAPHA